ncbi:MAG TPA: immune inhibitor A domain-containing protein [Gaiellaceae bacterium]|nr:immune inhibitor A domain-containing protein [Gaiellaceae bacterium]
MKVRRTALGAAILALALVAVSGASAGADATKGSTAKEKKNGGHILWTPELKKQAALKREAVEAKLAGKAKGKTFKTKSGEFVELEREATDRVFVIIVEFGDTRHPFYPDLVPDTRPTPAAAGFEGPLHNAIPEPNRAIDNSTLWQADYDKAHYENMYFERMREYYEDQSSNRYSIEGDVTEWVKVPFNEARYGRNFCGSNVCTNVYMLIRDAMAFWVQGQLDSGKTLAEVNAYLSTFDKWDRNDADGDGNFDEPDRFIDHFQIVHAGGDEAAGDPQQGEDAIWSHRSLAGFFLGPQGNVGFPAGYSLFGLGYESDPLGNGRGATTIPSNFQASTAVWVGDYTIQPENGGLGVFAHEYAHDLGLPDLYDTSGNSGGGENTTGFWDLMSSGANIGDGGPDGIGDNPTNMSAWDKFQLGWLDYDEATFGQRSSHRLGPIGGTRTDSKQAVVMQLPTEQNRTDTQYGAPTSGTKAYWSGMGSSIDRRMTSPSFTVPATGTTSLSMQAWYAIETCWDYAYVQVVDGATTTNLVTSESDAANPNDQNENGAGISGISGLPDVCDEVSGDPTWVPVTADLSAWAGKTIKLQVRYWADPFVEGRGFEWDDLRVTNGSTTVFSDDAEGGVTWELGGWTVFPGFTSRIDDHYYIAEYRPHRDYDQSLATAYNFGFLNTDRPDWVEFQEYNPGMLVWYWDLGYTDNSTSDHPGQGEALPVDANPVLHHWSDGQLMRGRIQAADGAFSQQGAKKFTLHKDGVPTTIGNQKSVSVFDDTKTWWVADDGHSAASHGRHQVPWLSVNPPKTGTSIGIKSVHKNGLFMDIEVNAGK